MQTIVRSSGAAPEPTQRWFGYAAAQVKLESPQFTAADIHRFLDEFREHERELLARRLEDVGRRLQELAPRLLTLDAGGADLAEDGAWNAREVVAHLALVSKLYGVLAYRVATGKDTSYDLLGIVRLRDVAGEDAARQPVAAHLEAIAADHERSLRFLRTASLEDLERAADTGVEGLKMSAVDVLRLPLVGHLELHLEQLEKAVG